MDDTERLRRDVDALKTGQAVTENRVDRLEKDVHPLLSLPVQIAQILTILADLKDARQDSEGGGIDWGREALGLIKFLVAALLLVLGVKASGLLP